MTHKETARLDDELSRGASYLEYGAGGSTLRALRHENLVRLVSVESDPDFVTRRFRCRPDVEAAVASGRLTFCLPDLGPTGHWGAPSDSARRADWPHYAQCPYENSAARDLILVDGRFRVACGILAALSAPDATVLVHDYDRSEYHVLERFLDVVERVDNLLVARAQSEFSERHARRLLKRYAYLPWDVPMPLHERLMRFLGKAKPATRR